jgi:hypothetical protein
VDRASIDALILRLKPTVRLERTRLHKGKNIQKSSQESATKNYISFFMHFRKRQSSDFRESELRSWVQIPPGPFLSARELRYYFKFNLGSCRTKTLATPILHSLLRFIPLANAKTPANLQLIRSDLNSIIFLSSLMHCKLFCKRF